ncbi:MAG: GNAT family N-acetyltransferase, partial [Saprospiraceae bacterium]
MEALYVQEHIQLTAFQQSDKANLLRHLNDLSIYQNTLTIPFPYEEGDADWWLGHVQEVREKNGTICNWAIRHAEHGLIGSIGFFLKSGVEGHFDEIGYWLAEPFRGQGIMTN